MGDEQALEVIRSRDLCKTSAWEGICMVCELDASKYVCE